MVQHDRLTYAKIRERAESTRKSADLSPTEFPVDIETVIELKHKIELIPTIDLHLENDVIGFLTSNRKAIYIDEDIYLNQRYENPLRFALAHELGHYILHEKVYARHKFSSVGEWVNFRSKLDRSELIWFEQQASEFAGRFLVPFQPLLNEVGKHKHIFNKYNRLANHNAHESVIKVIAGLIAPDFCVSEQVIAKRISNENILENLGFSQQVA